MFSLCSQFKAAWRVDPQPLPITVMNEAEKAHERTNNKLFYGFIVVALLVVAVVMMNRDPADAQRSSDRKEAVKACSEREMNRAYHQGYSPNDEDIERIVVNCMNAHPRER